MDRYATHLPVLELLGRKLPIRSVLELGCGLYSTAAFLDRAMFPYLESLDSVEVDEEWRKVVTARYGHDKRHRVLEKRPATLKEGYDLVFVDDGTQASDRAKSIKAVTTYPALIVIHDYEVLEYQQVAKFDSVRVYTHRRPWTAVCWNGARIDAEVACQQLFS